MTQVFTWCALSLVKSQQSITGIKVGEIKYEVQMETSRAACLENT